MKNNILSIFRFFLIFLVLFVCLVSAAAGFAAYRLPSMAAEKYGPPSSSLSFTQRVLYSFRLLSSDRSLRTPLDPKGVPQSFTVKLGESVNSIATSLEEEHLIANADAFRTYLIYAGLDKGVQAGKYRLSPAMSTLQIAHALQDATPEEVDFNILPGWRAEEIAAALPTSGLNVKPADFLALVNNPPADLLPAGLPQTGSLEGFLLPGEYQVKRGATARDLVSLFLHRFDEKVTPDLRQGFSDQGLTLAEAVILASMVQREAIVSDEQPIIASVFYNRLGQAMKLDSDPTVQYALGYDQIKQTWWKNPLTQADLQIDSSYNTYIYPGLPPGPICNPTIEALTAVAHPAETGYFYFRAKCDGSGRHAFAVTYEEHIQNACP